MQFTGNNLSSLYAVELQLNFTRHPVSHEVTIGQNVSLFCDLSDELLSRSFVHYSPDGNKEFIEFTDLEQ